MTIVTELEILLAIAPVELIADQVNRGLGRSHPRRRGYNPGSQLGAGPEGRDPTRHGTDLETFVLTRADRRRRQVT